MKDERQRNVDRVRRPGRLRYEILESLRSVTPTAEQEDVNHDGELGKEESTRTLAATVSSCATWAGRFSQIVFKTTKRKEALLVARLGSRRTLESTPLG